MRQWVISAIVCAVLLVAVALASSGFERPVTGNYFIAQVFDNFRTDIDPPGYHTGIDYVSDNKTVRVTAPGTVRIVQVNGQGCSPGCNGPRCGCQDHGLGNAVVVEHTLTTGSTVFSLYGHLAPISPGIKPGVCLAAGSPVGIIGRTGYGINYWPEEHLHFEIKTAATLGNPTGAGSHWGYTRPGSAVNYGYLAPANYLLSGTQATDCSRPAPTDPLRILDLNDDGASDVFLYNVATGARSTQLTDASGGFSATSALWDPGWRVHPADLNDDRLVDFFLYDRVRGFWLQALNNGSGGFAYFSGTFSPEWQIYVAKLDLDSIDDILVYNTTTGVGFECIANGSGGFARFYRVNWDPGWEVHVARLDFFPSDDLFLYNRSTGRWVRAFNNGDGTFVDNGGVWSPLWTISIADLNGDGVDDVFLYNPDTGLWFTALNTITDFLYNSGTWSPSWRIYTGRFNADGCGDLFLYNRSSGAWFEMYSNCAGGFPSNTNGRWSSGWDIYVTEFNADAVNDPFLYNFTTGAWFKFLTVPGDGFSSQASGIWSNGWTITANRTASNVVLAPTPTPSPAPTPTRITISGNAGFAGLDQTTQLSATAVFPNGATQDVTSQTTWQSANTAVAGISGAGVVSARAAGSADIVAAYGGLSGRVTVFVVPISAQATRYVRDFNQAVYRANTRWTASPVTVWADPGFRRADLQRAIDLWQATLPGLIQFVIADSRTRANIVFEFDPSISVWCGQEGPREIREFVILSGYGAYSPRPECTGQGNAASTGLAHGLGHIMGFLGHTPDNTDVMSAPNVPFRMSPELADAMKWIYSVPPGTRLVQ